MKSKAVVCAILALSLTTGSISFAQGYPGRNDRDRDEPSQRGSQQDRRNNEARHDGRHDNRARQPQRRDDRGQAYYQERRGERGAGPNHQYYRGDRLPVYYRSHQYVVDDWRGHRLSAPPRGYHWVQSGGDYLLVAIATGVILQLLLNN